MRKWQETANRSLLTFEHEMNIGYSGFFKYISVRVSSVKLQTPWNTHPISLFCDERNASSVWEKHIWWQDFIFGTNISMWFSWWENLEYIKCRQTQRIFVPNFNLEEESFFYTIREISHRSVADGMVNLLWSCLEYVGVIQFLSLCYFRSAQERIWNLVLHTPSDPAELLWRLKVWHKITVQWDL